MTGYQHWFVGYVIDVLSNLKWLEFTLPAFRRVNRVGAELKSPVMVTDRRPPRYTCWVTLTWGVVDGSCGVTLHCVVASGFNWRPPSPSKVSVVPPPFGVSVPSTVAALVVLTVPLPVKVPESHT